MLGARGITVHAFVMKTPKGSGMPEIVAENLTQEHRRPLRRDEHHHGAAGEDEGARRAAGARSPQHERVVRGRHPDRRDRLKPVDVAVAARRRPAADLEQPPRSVSAAAGLYFPPMADTTIPDKSLAAILDLLDKANVARRRAVSRATPPRGSRCTSSTAARTCSRPTRRRSSAPSRCARCRSTRPTRRRSPSALGLDPALAAPHLPARRRKADARAGRGLPDRLRGRLRQPAGSPRRTSTRSAPPPRSRRA